MAGSHLSRPIGESSKIVPSFTENCLPHPLHFQMRRVDRKEFLSELQRGQVTPSGQRRLARNDRLTSGSEKYRMASTRVVGAAMVGLFIGYNMQPSPGCVKYIIALTSACSWRTLQC